MYGYWYHQVFVYVFEVFECHYAEWAVGAGHTSVLFHHESLYGFKLQIVYIALHLILVVVQSNGNGEGVSLTCQQRQRLAERERVGVILLK